MAGVFNRFSLATENIIEQLKNNSKNTNTAKSTTFWIGVFHKWCEVKKVNPKIEDYELDALNRLLENFYAEVKNQNWK